MNIFQTSTGSTTVYRSFEDARALAADLQRDDPEWRYEPARRGKFWAVAVRDEHGFFLGNL